MCRNEEMQLLLSGRLDGCNTLEEEHALDQHLAECADCRQALEDYKKIGELLRETRQEVPADFTANVMRAVEAEPRRVEAKPKKRRLPFGFATAAAAVAAALILAVNAGWLPGLNQGTAKLFPHKAADAVAPEAAPAEAEAPAQAPEAVAEEAALAPAPKERVALPAAGPFFVSDGASTMVFHSPHAGQRPIHLGLSLPHEVQYQTVFTFPCVAIVYAPMFS